MAGINRRLFDQGLQQIYRLGGGGIASVLTSHQTVSTDTDFAGTTRNITITSVDISNVIMIPQISAISGPLDRACANFELTSSTNLRLTKGSASNGSVSNTFEIEIWEVNPELIKSNQFISSAYTAVAFDDVTITAVVVDNSIAISHFYDNDSGNGSQTRHNRANLTSTTNARLAAVPDFGSGTVRGQVIEFI